MSQNAKQLPTSDYSYTLYDAIGRITEVGQINNVQAMDDSISRVPDRLNAWINNVVTPKNQMGTDYRPLYNGNISSMAVNIGKLQNPLLYNYRYDQLNRLTAMNAWKADSSFQIADSH